jgi:hypothetical protein
MSRRPAPPKRPTFTVNVPPVETELDGAKVTVVEVTSYTAVNDEKRYIVSCIVETDGYRSQLFRLDVRDNEELARQLRIEIAKMRLMLRSGFTLPFQRIA